MSKMDETYKMDFNDLFPFVLLAFAIIYSIIVAANTYTGSYEYETIDGEKGIAAHCDTPRRGVPYCRLDDGTMVYGIKQYKKIEEEEE